MRQFQATSRWADSSPTSRPARGVAGRATWHIATRAVSGVPGQEPRSSRCSDQGAEAGPVVGRVQAALLGAVLAAGLALGPGPAGAEVALPEDGGATTVLDYARLLSPRVATSIDQDLRALEAATGFQVRVLTSDGEAALPSARALARYWPPSPRSLTAAFDTSRGNVVDFYYDSISNGSRAGPSVQALLPKNFFAELRGRYGNVYYIEEEGLEASVAKVTEVLQTCLAKAEGCNFVPGLSQQQREFTLVPITSGGFLAGAVLRNKVSRWTYIFLFIWGPWITLFGFWPFFLRQPENLFPALENLAIFGTCFGLTYLSPVLGKPQLPSVLTNGGGEDAGDGDGDGGGQE